MVKSGIEKAIEYVRVREIDSQRGIDFNGPAITISRESGSGSGLVAEHLKQILDKNKSREAPDWTVFDKNLIDKILADHNLPGKLAKLLTQEKQSVLKNMLNELMGLQPSVLSLYRKSAQTILELAEMGNVIIVGRGGNLITKNLSNSYHVRLVAPLQNRVLRIQEYYNLSRKEAIEWIEAEDGAREEFYRKNFLKRIDDPLCYHLIINTGNTPHKEAAHLIAQAVIARFPVYFQNTVLSGTSF